MDEVITLVSLIATVLTGAASIFWSNHFKEAKDAQIQAIKERLATVESAKADEIRAKDAEIGTLQRHVQILQDLTPPKLREIMESSRAIYEQHNDLLQDKVREMGDKIAELETKGTADQTGVVNRILPTGEVRIEGNGVLPTGEVRIEGSGGLTVDLKRLRAAEIERIKEDRRYALMELGGLSGVYQRLSFALRRPATPAEVGTALNIPEDEMKELLDEMLERYSEEHAAFLAELSSLAQEDKRPGRPPQRPRKVTLKELREQPPEG